MRSAFSQEPHQPVKKVDKQNQRQGGNFYLNKDKQRSNASLLTLNKKFSEGSEVNEKKKNYGINELENLYLISTYQRELLNQNKKIPHSSFLFKHDVTPAYRSKMVDWMIQIIASFKCSDRCLFKAIEIMDSYYSKSQKAQKFQDLHLVGVTALLLANKMQQISALKIKVFHQKISHRKLSIAEITNKQTEMFQLFNFNLNVHSLFDSIQIVLASFCIESQHYQKLEKIATFMAKMVAYEYSIISTFSKQVISYTIIELTLRKAEQVVRRFDATPYLTALRKQSKLFKSDIMECFENIRKLVKNFDNTYQNLPNFRKYTKVVIEGKDLRTYF